MTIEEVQQKAEDMATRYNPEGLSPFPFENIPRDKKDIQILLNDGMPDDVSGIAGFFPEKQGFAILINKNKPPARRYFTIAHELGHYFLHQEEMRRNPFVDKDPFLDRGGMPFRYDSETAARLEMEANNFGASLIMSAELVKKAWSKLKSVEECAEVFNVSVEAMSIRLTKLGLLN